MQIGCDNIRNIWRVTYANVHVFLFDNFPNKAIKVQIRRQVRRQMQCSGKIFYSSPNIIEYSPRVTTSLKRMHLRISSVTSVNWFASTFSYNFWLMKFNRNLTLARWNTNWEKSHVGTSEFGVRCGVRTDFRVIFVNKSYSFEWRFLI